MATQAVDYAALAKQAGAVSSAPAAQAPQPGVDYTALAKQAGAIDSTPSPGEIRNDVGNRVIIPKDDEKFDQTMQRAAAYGKSVTQPQIDAEMATAPKKAAQVMAAAPAIGAAGAAGLAGAGELGGLVKNVPGLAKPALQWISANPVKAYLAYKVADELGLGPSAIRKLLHLASGVEPE